MANINSREITEVEVISKQRGHLYEISATATLPALKDPEEFSCKLHIPEANYTTREDTVFYPVLIENEILIRPDPNMQENRNGKQYA
ncbi:hypothetical protein NQ317_016367 [Molorchus minor]|uniref:Uncharacterized protein n=1 Tax=Molorchus minor TaxID=1323400 RepID=A0ABQ9JBU6_9CUCU|nr:hypothetical protein NQ317_016367 [Molorchus minor]